MDKNTTIKISLMMFLYYFSLGLITPMLTYYLMGSQYLGFSGSQAGLISGMQALALIFSPLVGAFITDRFISAEKLMGVLQIASGITLLLFPFVSSFPLVLILFALYQILFIPGTALTNTIAFHHSPDGGNHFGRVRKWGTIGWIFAGLGVLLFGMLYQQFNYRQLFGVAGLAAIALGVFSFFAFPTKKSCCDSLSFGGLLGETGLKAPRIPFLPVEAFRVVMRKEVLLIILISILVKLVDKYYYFGCSPFLQFQGVGESWIPALMSLGQITEVVIFIFLGPMIARWGYRRILFLGILSEVCRFFILSLSSSVWITLLAFPFHGMSFAFFSGTVYIFINQGTDRRSRAGVQHLYALITGVVGNFFGATIPGAVVGTQPMNLFADYRLFWLIPAGMAILAGALVLFLKSANGKQNRQVI